FMLVSSAAAADAGPKFKGWGGTGPYPVVNFSADKTTGQAPLTVQFFDNSTYEGTLVSRLWDFGALGTSTAANPTVTFTSPGTYVVSLRIENTTGYMSNQSGEHPINNAGYTLPTITVTAGTSLAADFTWTPSGDVDVGYTVQFNDTSVGNPTAWLWDFGDTTPTSSLQNPTHVFTKAQDYSVKLTVTNSTGQTSSVTKTVTVKNAESPVANFTTNPDPATGIAPLNVTFTDASTKNPTSWVWQFGDGATSTEQDTYHVYTLPGTYTVNLTVTNAAGSNTTSKSVTVTGPNAPIANFTANGVDASSTSPGPTLNGAAPFSVNFVDNSSTDADKQATSWLWTFGDGQSSTQRNPPTHVFPSPGTYLVQFTASNSGGSSSAFMTIVVGPTQVPVANFTFNSTASAPDGQVFNAAPEMLVTGKAIWFNSTSTNAPTSTTWTFSDGVTSTQTNFMRTFSTAGSYWVLLSVSNSAGSSSKINFFTITDAVGQSPVASFQMEGQGHTVANGGTLTVTLPAVVNFTNTSTNTPTSWTWFSDGEIFATTANATHNFTQAGTFPIQLIVSNAFGSSSANGTIVVQAPTDAPVASFTYTPTAVLPAPATIQFTDTSTNYPTTWSWNFDDGTPVSTLQNPTHTFQHPGNYTVRLTASNSAGSSQTTQLITVSTLQPPVASFRASSATAVASPKTSADAEIQGPIPFTVNFTDTSTMNPTSVFWHITGTGVDVTRTTSAFDYTFTTPGKYNVQLIAYNAAGQNTIYKPTFVNVTAAAPSTNFTWTPTSPVKGQSVQFTDTTLYGPTVWSWSFGDGGLSSAQNPPHTYENAGTYTVTLTTWNSQGTSTATKTITVANIVPPVANFTWSPEEPKVGDLVTFTDTSTNNPTAWTWVIENTQYTVQNPTVTFTTPGTKIAFLIASNAAGPSAAKLVQINVTEPPVTVTPTPEVPIVADFTMDKDSGTAPLTVQFASTSTGPYTDLDWTILLGDDVVDTMVGETPSYTFATPGTYTVLLEASNSGTGETSTKEKTVTVNAVTTTTTTVTTTTPIGGNQPYPSAHVMPGRVEAEDYDVTAGYPAYSDTTPANEGGAYRQDAVDIEVGGTNFNVGWIRPTEFLTYSVDVPSGAAGTYTIGFRMVNPSGTKSFAVYVDGVLIGAVNLPATGSFNTWTTVNSPSFQMTEGRHVIKVDFVTTTSINFDYMQIQGGAPVTTTTTVVTTTTTAQPTTGGASFTAIPIPVKKGAAIKFTVTPATGKTIRSAWWTFDKNGHYSTWNSRTINPTFYYPAVGTYTPLVILTYTDGTTETVERAGYVRVIA
ncbi:MAG TPA: PKD domain-containing protein, partial [Methanoregulaceae archaeon]|nr:PKD domain-containing protein [Methanoregulaceae archaeon]